MKISEMSEAAKASLFGLVFIPWLVFLCVAATNINAVWFTTCARRLLDGQSLITSCYDANPPLSILIYLIPALLEKYAGWPKTVALPLYEIILFALSALAVSKILRAQYGLTDAQRRVVFFSYLLANTMLVQYWFGDRDHFIALGLFPMALLQLGLTRGHEAPTGLKWPVLALGSVAVLIKPHYLLIPGAIFAHRAWRQKRLSVFGDADFAALAAAAAAYALLLYAGFADYVHLVLPDALRLYILSSHYGSVWPLTLGAGALAALVLRGVLKQTGGDAARDISAILLMLALLCLIPYALQNKGYTYHFIPAMVFLFCGLSLPLMRRLKDGTGNWTRLLLTAISCVTLPLMLVIPHHDTLENYAVTREASAGGPGCAFFLFDNVYDVQNVAHYACCEHASRFSDLWFLQTLLQEKYNADHRLPHVLAEGEIDAYARKFAGMVTGDFRRWNPDIVIIAKIRMIREEPFDFAAWFSAQDPDFAALWKNYALVRTITSYYPHYLFGDNDRPGRNDVTFLVYRRSDHQH